jgi:TRAP-type C4-dicarboxylate transport system permease small subunit
VSDGVVRALAGLSDVLIIVFSVFLIVYGWDIISISFTVIAPATEIPMSYFQMIFIVFGLVCIYRSIIHLVLLVRTRELKVE